MTQTLDPTGVLCDTFVQYYYLLISVLSQGKVAVSECTNAPPKTSLFASPWSPFFVVTCIQLCSGLRDSLSILWMDQRDWGNPRTPFLVPESNLLWVGNENKYKYNWKPRKRFKYMTLLCEYRGIYCESKMKINNKIWIIYKPVVWGRVHREGWKR